MEPSARIVFRALVIASKNHAVSTNKTNQKKKSKKSKKKEKKRKSNWKIKKNKIKALWKEIPLLI